VPGAAAATAATAAHCRSCWARAENASGLAWGSTTPTPAAVSYRRCCSPLQPATAVCLRLACACRLPPPLPFLPPPSLPPLAGCVLYLPRVPVPKTDKLDCPQSSAGPPIQYVAFACDSDHWPLPLPPQKVGWALLETGPQPHSSLRCPSCASVRDSHGCVSLAAWSRAFGWLQWRGLARGRHPDMGHRAAGDTRTWRRQQSTWRMGFW